MKIAIQNIEGLFCSRWIEYCKENNIKYKLVDCYKSDIISQITDCDALMWHFSQNSPKAILFAKQLIYSVEASGKKVFPDFNTVWHFDDKVGQKYLMEALSLPLVPTWVFYDKQEAIKWATDTDFPKVFKLRGGAGSQNVRLVNSLSDAKKLIRTAFRRGFPSYYAIGSLKERFRLFRLGKSNIRDLIEGLVRLIIPPTFARITGRQIGYIYFQNFIPFNDHDIRVIVIAKKAFAIKRIVRKNDFRASGGGNIEYSKELFDEGTLKLSFELATKLKTQCVAFDFIYKDNSPFVVEISYGFSPAGYQLCPGYWDNNLNWHEGEFNPYGWMVDLIIQR
jgi:glutathione synthase/RimK-type ligase-like ATP-grasp enzyme